MSGYWSAFAGQNSSKYAGAFSFGGETKGEAMPEQLERAWYAQLEKIKSEPIPAEELQKVKNQIAADAYRRLQNPFFLMLQLLFYEGLGDWEYLNDWSGDTLAVTEADVKRVAGTYFAPENRAVAVYNRKAGSQTEEWPPELAGLPAQQQQMIKGQLRQLKQIQDPAQLEGILQKVQQQKEAVPAEMRDALGLIEKWIEDRIEQLREGGGEEGGA